MSEVIWLGATAPRPLLDLLTDRASTRKLRLFACACCREFDDRLGDEARTHLDLCESFLDAGVGFGALFDSERRLGRRQRELQQELLQQGPRTSVSDHESLLFAVSSLTGVTPFLVALNVSHTIRLVSLRVPYSGVFTPDLDQERKTGADQANLLRDIFPNPFRPLPLGPAATDSIRHLAQTIYNGRRFDHLPILADALEEAGCTSDTVLAHCRGPGPHVLGCWVVDALLGKT